jgi:hypothetical protein
MSILTLVESSSEDFEMMNMNDTAVGLAADPVAVVAAVAAVAVEYQFY